MQQKKTGQSEYITNSPQIGFMLLTKKQILPTTKGRQIYLWFSLHTNRFIKCHTNKHTQQNHYVLENYKGTYKLFFFWLH